MKQNIGTLKEYFEAGDKPTQQNYHDLIDSIYHKDEGKIITAYSVAENGDLTLTFNDGIAILIEKLEMPDAIPLNSIVGLTELLNSKVEKVGEKSLSTNDFTDELKQKLETASIYPADYPASQFNHLSPLSLIPFTSNQINVYGEFFKPVTDMSFRLVNDGSQEGDTADELTINSIEFVSSTHYKLNITPNNFEQAYDLIISDGIETTINNAFTVSSGATSVPEQSDWQLTSNIDLSTIGQAKIVAPSSSGSASLIQTIPENTDFIFSWKFKRSSLHPAPKSYGQDFFKLLATDNTEKYLMRIHNNNDASAYFYIACDTNDALDFNTTNGTSYGYSNLEAITWSMRRINNIVQFGSEYNGVLNTGAANSHYLGEMKVNIAVKEFDMVDIKLSILN